MAPTGFQFSAEDLRNILISGVVVGAAFAAYKTVTSPIPMLTLLFFGLITVSAREIGQRMVAQSMEAEVSSEVSRSGAVTTLVVAMLSYISSFSLVFLVPVFSSFSVESHQHWGKGIDAIWAKREYWLASAGITSLLVIWALAFLGDYNILAEMIALFTFFQLLPLDAEKGICGKLDGAYIMLWTGFTWLIFMGLTIIAMILSVL
ncbi:hypothetical protein [Candidatus Nanohalobium constans]|uniref:Uncharacterized protein n=1 Tax=Candidatus Nanohalobium constans TaxID=2565781 RepID=A0A5Q0UI55_9ARCH|nr:hypothetical protein [Candidatus Nanohalobium constans]QGA80559.1 hypothetical protein LC1Nh_0668 [Candidatus Nanohalobium constans]